MKAFFELLGVLLLTLFFPLAGIWRLAAVSCGSEYLTGCTINNLVVWQAAIGAIVGFNGLLIGALYNARLNRQRDNRQRDERSYALAASLAVEIDMLQTMMRNRIQIISESVDNDEPIPSALARRLGITPPTPVYDNNTGDFGLIEAAVFIRASNSYLHLKESFSVIDIVATSSKVIDGKINPKNFDEFVKEPYKVCDQAIGATVDLFNFAGRTSAAEQMKRSLDLYMAKEREKAATTTKVDVADPAYESPGTDPI